jgi:site-specific DNA recombinase
MRAVIYCRVSTDDQDKEGTSLQTQRDACLAFCKQKGYEVVNRFSETYSGLTIERPELNRLRDLIRNNEIDVLVIYCLDRLSRNATHGVIIRDELDQHHVLLESVTEDIDKSPLGEAITYLRGTFAQIEAEKIRERTMRGKQARLKEGKLPHGTGKGIYGYDWHKETGRRSINESEAKVVQKIFTMILKGYSFNKIAIEFNNLKIKSKSGSLWHPLTIRRIATNETYTGKTYSCKTKRVARGKVIARPVSEWVSLPNITPPIITEEMFKRVQDAILKHKQEHTPNHNAVYLLTGFAKCSKCGTGLIGTTLTDKKRGYIYRYYQCRGSRPTATRGKICDAGYIKADKLEKLVIDKFTDMIMSPLLLANSILDSNNEKNNSTLHPTLDKDIRSLRKKLKSYPLKEKNLYNLLAHDNVTKEFVLDSIQQINLEREIDEKQLEHLLSLRDEINSSEYVTLNISPIITDKQSNYIDSLDFKERRQLFEGYRLEVKADPKDFSLTIKLGAKVLTYTKFLKLEAKIEKLFKEFQNEHPNSTYQEYIDFVTKEKSEDFTKIFRLPKNHSNLNSNLVTIERTSASRHADNYQPPLDVLALGSRGW